MAPRLVSRLSWRSGECPPISVGVSAVEQPGIQARGNDVGGETGVRRQVRDQVAPKLLETLIELGHAHLLGQGRFLGRARAILNAADREQRRLDGGPIESRQT